MKETWTTWEELLLACAVKRHGLKDWGSIAMELQTRRTSESSVPVFTAQICRNKYGDLKRRFTDEAHHRNDVARGGDEVDDEDNTVPWVEELRKLRIAELRRELQHHDLSIQTLQLKVKRLEGEREQSMRENDSNDRKTDLEKDLEEERSENDKNDTAGAPAEEIVGDSVSGERSERESRSVNESNSTQNRETRENIEVREPEPVQAREIKPDPESPPARADSWNDSSKPSEENKVDDESIELRSSKPSDSAEAESKQGTKDSSDVQSSASLTKKKQKRMGKEVSAGGGGEDEPVASPATMRQDSVKSEPLIRFIDIIRSHKHGSMFESRLESQKSDNYKCLIRQHVDLQTLQTRIEDGSYSSCPTKFYLDLLLIFNNAIVFFPIPSPESVAAFKLRGLVSKELKKKRIGQSSDPSTETAPVLLQPKPELEGYDSLLAKHKSSAPFIVCRKRSSISAKPSTSNKADEKPVTNPKPPVKSSSTPLNEEDSSIKLKLKEKPVTGVRSMRRSSNTRTSSTNASTKSPMANASLNPTSTNKGEAPKVEKKKTEAPNTVKKRGAADFLKRIKKNSPVKPTPLESSKSYPEDSNGNNNSRRDQSKKRVDDRKEVAPRQKGGGSGGSSGSGKQVKEEDSPSKRSVGRPPKRGKEAAPVKRRREGSEEEVAAKRPKKRNRR